MDESAQQAISIGVNVTIFIVALSITLTLLFAVRDIAEVSTSIDENIPDGSMILATQDFDSRIISGFEVISYYYNYIKPYYEDETESEYNHPNVGVVIKTGNQILKKEFINGNIDSLQKQADNLNYSALINKIDLNSNYTLAVQEHYNNTNSISGTTVIYIEQIPELLRSQIYSFYVSNVKPIFINPETSNMYSSCALNIIVKEKDTSVAINVNSDSENGDEKVREVINGLNSTKKYSIRIKRRNVKENMTSSSIVLYIE